jgi:hypothetical protein
MLVASCWLLVARGKSFFKHCGPAGLSVRPGNRHLISKPDFLKQIHGFTPKTSLQSGKNKEISGFKNTHGKEVLLKSVETWCAWSRSALAQAKSIG